MGFAYNCGYNCAPSWAGRMMANEMAPFAFGHSSEKMNDMGGGAIFEMEFEPKQKVLGICKVKWQEKC